MNLILLKDLKYNINMINKYAFNDIKIVTLDDQCFYFKSWEDVLKIKNNVKRIICSSCKLKELPELDFPNLIELFCSYNLLTKLPKLPEKLEELYCCVNYLTELPELPKSLKILKCDGNKFLNHLPKLPKDLEKIYLDKNLASEITQIPENTKIIIF
jgi:Leucine-rich repeat (LRR) protein